MLTPTARPLRLHPGSWPTPRSSIWSAGVRCLASNSSKLGESLCVLRATGELLGNDDVAEVGNLDVDVSPSRSQRDRPLLKGFVADWHPICVRDADQDVDSAKAGLPGGDLTFDEHFGRDCVAFCAWPGCGELRQRRGGRRRDGRGSQGPRPEPRRCRRSGVERREMWPRIHPPRRMRSDGRPDARPSGRVQTSRAGWMFIGSALGTSTGRHPQSAVRGQ